MDKKNISLYRVNLAGKNAALVVRSNPVTDRFGVQVQALKAQHSKVIIIDINGKVLLSKQVEIARGQTIIPMDVSGSLSPGFYLLTIGVGGKIQYAKFMKQ